MDEKNNKRRVLARYGIAAAVGLVLAFAVMYRQGVLTLTNRADIFRVISDGFFVAAVLYIGIGLLLYVSSTGSLDIIYYGFRSLLYLFTPAKRDRSEGGFYEYKVRQKEKRKPVPFHIVWIGIGYLLLTFLFLWLYTSAR